MKLFSLDYVQILGKAKFSSEDLKLSVSLLKWFVVIVVVVFQHHEYYLI